MEEHWKIILEAWCDRCDKQYVCLEKLRIHLKKEHGIDFVCEQCDESFRHNEELEEHIKSRHAEEIECTECNEKFVEMEVLRMHIRKEHGIVEGNEGEEEKRDDDKIASKENNLEKEKNKKMV